MTNVLASLKSVLDRVARVEILHRVLPVGYDRMGREYWLLESQSTDLIGGLNSTQGNSVLDEPVLLVRDYYSGKSWSYITRKDLPRFMMLMESSANCYPSEDFLMRRIKLRFPSIVEGIRRGALKIREVAWHWLTGFCQVDKWIRDTAELNTNWEDNSQGLMLLELAYVRCTEVRLSVHYATLVRHLGYSTDHKPADLDAMLTMTSEGEGGRRVVELETNCKRKLQRSKIIDLIYDLHISSGWHRSDIFARIRSLSACSTATDLLADPQARDAVRSIMQRCPYRKRVAIQQLPAQLRAPLQASAAAVSEAGTPSSHTRQATMARPINVGHSSSKPVDQLHIETGEVLRTWNSGSEAAHVLNLSHTGISQCCNGNKADANGFKWRFSTSTLRPILQLR